MAKKSKIQKNLKVILLSNKYKDKRSEFRSKRNDKSLSLVERYEAQKVLSSLPRNSSFTRIRNRCEITGRSRGFIRKAKVSRICFRSLAAFGMIPGVKKSSW